MKKIFSLFTVAFISMFALVLGVNAKEVADATELSEVVSKSINLSSGVSPS